MEHIRLFAITHATKLNSHIAADVRITIQQLNMKRDRISILTNPMKTVAADLSH
jgi:hypothetical protein